MFGHLTDGMHHTAALLRELIVKHELQKLVKNKQCISTNVTEKNPANSPSYLLNSFSIHIHCKLFPLLFYVSYHFLRIHLATYDFENNDRNPATCAFQDSLSFTIL